MAGEGYRVWVPGEVITADNVQGYLMDQTVQVYADSTARGTALTGYIAEGMVSYLEDTNSVEVYDGAAWVGLGGDAPIFTSGTSGEYLKSLGTAGVEWDSVPTPGSATPLAEGIVFGKTPEESGLGNGITALGFEAGRVVTTNGIFIGPAAGYNATTANGSTLVGEWAGIGITTGSSNTGIGNRTLSSTTDGSQNVALGHSAAINTNASNRVAIGYNAGFNGMGDGNVFIGALVNQSYDASTATNNTIIGNAAAGISSGTNNIVLGNQASPSTGSVSNQITLGNANITGLRCAVTSISSLSDERDKKNIADLPIGLDFINNLRPVRFEWDTRIPDPIEYPDGTTKVFTKDDVKTDVPDMGFIAQDLVTAEDSIEAHDWLQLTLRDNPDKLEATQGRLIPILVKAVQELSAEVESLKQQLG